MIRRSTAAGAEPVTEPPQVMVLGSPSRGVSHVDGSPLEGASRVRHVDWDESMSDAEKLRQFDAVIADCDAVIVSPWFVPRPVVFTEQRWESAPRLRVIAGTFDNRFDGWLDVADAESRGVIVVDTSRSMTPTVAEFALAMTLNLLRDIPSAVQHVREGGWCHGGWGPPGVVHGDLAGRSVGLAGFGSINRRYRELLGPFGCKVAACDPFVSDADLRAADVEPIGSLVELAASSEILVIGVPPTPATLGLVNAEVINALPRGSLMLVVTRMAVMDQAALWHRSEAGEIRVAVDVFDPEPPSAGASFRSSPWVLPTPHIAGNVTYCHRRCFTTACADALAVLEGVPPLYRATLRDQELYQGRFVHGK